MNGIDERGALAPVARRIDGNLSRPVTELSAPSFSSIVVTVQRQDRSSVHRQ